MSKLTKEDKDEATRLVGDFLGSYYSDLNVQGSLGLLDMALDQHAGMIAFGIKEEEKLVAILVACSPPFNPLFHPKKIAIEMLFYSVKKGAGDLVLKEFEDWAKDTGHTYTGVSVYTDTKAVHRYYEERGYTPYETNFKKVL